ncbi:MAG: hypothetical protein K5840_00645 [Eubacterium sp.]|nr:hypothetical protein [Eubacterium sp.]
MVTPKRYLFLGAGIFVFPIAMSVFLAWKRGIDFRYFDFFVYIFVSLLLSIMITAAFLHERKKVALYDAVFRDYKRVSFFVFLCALCTCIYPYLPAYSEPVIMLSSAVCLIMGPYMGFIIPCFMTLQYCLIMETGVYRMTFLFLMIIVGCIMDEEFAGKKSWIFYTSMILCIMASFSCLFFYFDKGYIEVNQVIVALISGFFSCLCIMILSRFLGRSMFKKDRARMMQLISGEYLLLSQMKEIDAEYFERCVFLSRVCGLIAGLIGADELLAKAGGLYYKLGRLEGKRYTVEDGMRIGLDFDFPNDLMWILYEQGGINRLPSTRVSGIIYIADQIISAFDREENLSSKMDYELVVHREANKLSTNGKIDECGISMNHFLRIRDYLIEVSAEYDRRFRKQH